MSERPTSTIDQFTVCILKPDACVYAGAILQNKLLGEFKVAISRLTFFTKADVELFYQEHAGKSFFPAHVEFMSKGPSLAMILRREAGDAVAMLRRILGNTDPEKAEEGTVRKEYGSKLPRNAAHGSDSALSVRREAALLFSGLELAEAQFPCE